MITTGNRKKALAPRRPPLKRPGRRTFPPPPYPTREQVDDFAIAIAVNDNIVDKHILRMICWRPGDAILDIPEGKRKKYFHAAQKRWIDALLLLSRCMEENHALMIRSVRRYGDRVRTRFWTAKPLRHGQTPPPRRRRYIPPVVPEKRASAPPGAPLPAEALPARHPDGCRLRGEDCLFGPGGGHRQGALRSRTGAPPLPKCVTTLLDN